MLAAASGASGPAFGINMLMESSKRPCPDAGCSTPEITACASLLRPPARLQSGVAQIPVIISCGDHAQRSAPARALDRCEHVDEAVAQIVAQHLGLARSGRPPRTSWSAGAPRRLGRAHSRRRPPPGQDRSCSSCRGGPRPAAPPAPDTDWRRRRRRGARHGASLGGPAGTRNDTVRLLTPQVGGDRRIGIGLESGDSCWRSARRSPWNRASSAFMPPIACAATGRLPDRRWRRCCCPCASLTLT